MHTPLWLPLVVAAVGIVGTLSGVWLTQRRADKREAIAWKREQERERDRWAREDVARTFEQRRSAYEEILTALRAYGIELNGLVPLKQGGAAFTSLPGFNAVLKASDAVSIYGSPVVVDLAHKGVAAIFGYGVQLSHQVEGETTEILELPDRITVKISKERAESARRSNDEAVVLLRNAIRDELGVPTGTQSTPVS